MTRVLCLRSIWQEVAVPEPEIPDLAALHPVVHAPLRLLVRRVFEELGLALEVFDLWRDGAAQEAAFARGATKRRAGQSWHNLTFPDGSPASFAAHVRVILPGGRYLGFGDSLLEPSNAARRIHADIWENKLGEMLTAEHLVYTAVALKAEEIGFVSGSRWSRLQDWCHVEWHPDGATMEQVKTVLAAHGAFGLRRA